MKKLILAVIVAIMAFSVMGCGSQQDNKKPPVDTETNISGTENEDGNKEEIKQIIVSPITNGGEFKTND